MTNDVPTSFIERWLAPLLAVAGLLVWEIGVRGGQISSLFFPAPSSIFDELLAQIKDGSLLRDTGATLARLGVGFAFGAAAGLLAGLVMGWSHRVRRVLDPFVAALHPPARPAWRSGYDELGRMDMSSN